jgi:hypothetical protein
LTCTRAKTHCDGAYPNCSRCLAKSLTCRYERPPLSSAQVVAPSTSSDESAEATLISASSLDFYSQSGMQLVQTSQNGFEGPLSSSPEYPGSNSVLPDIYDMSFSEPISSQTMRDPLLLSYPTSTSSSDSLYPDVEEALTFDHLLPKPPKAFDPRTVRNHLFSLNAKYMICTLRSYPLRMLPGKPRDLPSFIHPQCMSYISRDDRMIHDSHSSPLENCLAIMQMWSVKSKGNSSFIWSTIRMEQERLLSEVRPPFHSTLPGRREN